MKKAIIAIQLALVFGLDEKATVIPATIMIAGKILSATFS